MSNKVLVNVDFGQGINMWRPRESMLLNEKGKPINFESMIDALNFMAKKGWVFVDAYGITVGQQNVFHWIMKKEVPLSEIE